MTTPQEAARRWKELQQNQHKLESKTLDLIAHPEATDEQILTACKCVAASRKSLNESKPKLIAWLYKKGATLLANQLQGIR